ncbi:MAG TPA: permease prefix domain 1-containing protein, partial [Methylomirabilota bacterium]|nr:permease prefix domain 1-containing protein [Methylomirabilota bacterium]
MHDWHAYVREQSPELDDRVVQELAGHLEDVYSDLRASGLTQAEAIRRAERRVGGWLELRRGIQAARREEAMQERVKQFWLPSLVTLVLGWGILTI